MTRINIINPKELYDQHLIAEYREIFMVPAALKRTIRSKKGLIPNNIPKNYTLNKGHVYFFYDKGLYLEKRYNELITEMKIRGMNPNNNRIFPKNDYPVNLYNDWKPTEKDKEIARKRINDKISLKPHWYRKS